MLHALNLLMLGSWQLRSYIALLKLYEVLLLPYVLLSLQLSALVL
jgi:hypothetical protein